MTYTINHNDEFNSTEIFFDGKPSAAVRDTLKGMKFRWHGVKKCWYGRKPEAEVRAAIDAAINPADAYQIQTRPGYLGAIAWDGSNAHKGLYGADLSAALRQAFKTVGIKGVTVSCKTYTGGQHITLSIKAGAADYVTAEEYAANCRLHDFAAFGWVTDTDTGETVHEQDTCSWDGEKLDRVTRALALQSYADMTQHKADLNHYHIDSYKVFAPAFIEKLHLIRKVVDSFNYDDSNSMVDYFDRGFYESWKVIPEGAAA